MDHRTDPAAARAAGVHGYVPEIDALRALAMTAVALQHSKLLPFGWMGVWLFFVVSGFAITTSLLAGPARSQPPGLALWNFIARRAIRIWPAYFTFIGLGALYLVSQGRFGELEPLAYLATFTFNLKMILTAYGPEAPLWHGFGHLWTISVEEHFYLIFPFLFLFLREAALKRALWAFVIGAPLLRAVMGVGLEALPWDDGRRHFAVYAFAPAHFDAFAMGALLALERERIARNLGLARAILFAGVAALALYCAAYVALQAHQNGGVSIAAFEGVISGAPWGEGRQIPLYSAIAVASAGVIAAILAGEGWLKALARPSWLQWIGRISYGAYLYHLPAIFIVNAWMPGEGYPLWRCAAIFALAYPLTLALAALSHRFIEAPALKLRHRFA